MLPNRITRNVRFPSRTAAAKTRLFRSRWLLEQDGEIEIILPDRRLQIADHGNALAPA